MYAGFSIVLQIIMQEDHEPLIPGLLSSVKVVLLCSNYFHSLPNKVRKAEENEKQNAFFPLYPWFLTI